MTFFCPGCWHEIAATQQVCPFCGTDITEFGVRSFEEKLINSLRHPEPDTVQRAVWILGRLKSAKAVAPLSELFGKTDAPLLKMDILSTLEAIGSLDAIEAIGAISAGETGIVKKKAREIIGRFAGKCEKTDG